MASSTEQGDDMSRSSTSTASKSYFKADVVLRFLVFASTLSAIIVLVTSKQTVLATPRPFVAKFDHSPAFIYFLVALSVAGLYSLITMLASVLVMLKPQYSTKCSFYLAFWDVLMLGLVASATGTAGGVAYIGLKGNKHVRWMKICSIFDKFCKHVGSAVAVSLFASVILLVLVWLDLKALHKRIPK